LNTSHVVVRLRGSNKLSRTSLNRYEISVIVYETGFERFNTLVFQDQNQTFSGTAETLCIRCASTALQVLDSTARHIQRREEDLALSSGPPDPDPLSVGAQIKWSYFVDKDGTRCFPNEATTNLSKISLRTMNNVVSILVPLIFANPVLSNQTSSFLTLAAGMNAFMLAKDVEDSVLARTSNRISASFCLDTEEYRAAQRSRAPKAPRSLSNSFIQQNGLLAGEEVAKIGRTGSFPFATLAAKPALQKVPNLASVATTLDTPSAAASRGKSSYESWMNVDRIRKRQQELDAASTKMQGWVLEEKGVMVKCRTYVSIVMLTCVLLVAGGIGVGVTVGDRIPGVDPFNVTTYCWVLAAFVVLVAKSVRVHEWPWNDFLYGRVLCKSVSELSSVTGIHEQLIMAYLLQNETSFLQTRGPFNAVFRHRSDDGFSIDRPLSLWTLLLSGLIMVEGRSLKGMELVCLDLRRSTPFDSVPFRTEFRSFGDNKLDKEGCCVSCLICELPKERRVGPGSGSPQARLAWGRKPLSEPFIASGIYGNPDAQFV
jgi:hypothetical protein